MNKFFIYAVIILTSAFSLVCSINLWVSEQGTFEAMLMTGVVVAGLELSKYVAIYNAKQDFKSNPILGFFLYLASFVGLSFSIFSTVAFLEGGTVNKHEEAKKSSIQYQEKLKEVDSLNQQIKTMNGLMDSDLKGKYKDRAYKGSDSLSSLRDEKQKLLLEIDNIQIPVSGIDSLFVSVGETLSVEHKTVRQISYAGFALFVDAITMIFLVLLSVKEVEVDKKSQDDVDTDFEDKVAAKKAPKSRNKNQVDKKSHSSRHRVKRGVDKKSQKSTQKSQGPATQDSKVDLGKSQTTKKHGVDSKSQQESDSKSQTISTSSEVLSDSVEQFQNKKKSPVKFDFIKQYITADVNKPCPPIGREKSQNTAWKRDVFEFLSGHGVLIGDHNNPLWSDDWVKLRQEESKKKVKLVNVN